MFVGWSPGTRKLETVRSPAVELATKASDEIEFGWVGECTVIEDIRVEVHVHDFTHHQICSAGACSEWQVMQQSTFEAGG